MVAVGQLLQLVQVGGVGGGVDGGDVGALLGVEVVDVEHDGGVGPVANRGRRVHVGHLVGGERGDVERPAPVRAAIPHRRPVGVEDHGVAGGPTDRPGQVPPGGGRALVGVCFHDDLGEVVGQAADPVLRLAPHPVGGGDDRGLALGQVHGVEARRLGLGHDRRYETRLAP